MPRPDKLLWLGEEVVDGGTWMFVYTGPGQRRVTTAAGTNDPAIVIHWNQPTTVLHDSRLVPVIFQLSGILTPRSAETLGELVRRLGLSPGELPSMRVSASDIIRSLIAGPHESKPSAKLPSPEMFKAFIESQIKKK